MEQTLYQKKSFFNKVASFFGKLFKLRKKRRADEEGYSKFDYFLDYVDENSEEYSSVSLAVQLCDEAISIADRRIMHIERIKSINKSLEEIECYKRLDENEIKRLKDLLARYTSLTKDKRGLQDQLDSFEHSLSYLQTLEEEVPEAIKEITDAEHKQRIFKQDLGYLEGERSELIYERENLETGMAFIQKFTIGLSIFFGVATLVLVYMLVFHQINVITPMVSLIILIIIISAMLYAFRRRIIYELAINLKKQNKAVELINKKTVIYAHYTNFLNYEYKKFRVRNSEMLKDNLSDYGLYKHLVARQDAIRKILYQTEADLEDFMKMHSIKSSYLSLDKFTREVDIDRKLQVYNELQEEKLLTEKNLETLDSRHELIWDTLVELEEKDTSADQIIKTIIQEYIDVAGKLISH